MVEKIFKSKFFKKDVHEVARALLGQYLVKKSGDQVSKYLITEIEIYDGPEDLASHASKGLTKRTEIMFREGGYWYVYLIYGMYEMLNIVCGEKEYPAAILIRGVVGLPGPGKLTKALQIDRTFNGQKITPKTGLYIEKSGINLLESDIKKSQRIGVDYAGKKWASKLWRLSVDEKSLKSL